MTTATLSKVRASLCGLVAAIAVVGLAGCGPGAGDTPDAPASGSIEVGSDPASRRITLQYGALVSKSLDASSAEKRLPTEQAAAAWTSGTDPLAASALRVSVAEPILERAAQADPAGWRWSATLSRLNGAGLHAVVPVWSSSGPAESQRDAAPAPAVEGTQPAFLVLSADRPLESVERDAALPKEADPPGPIANRSGVPGLSTGGSVPVGDGRVGVVGASCEPLRGDRTAEQASFFLGTVQFAVDRLHRQGQDRILLLCSDVLEPAAQRALSTLQRVDVVVSRRTASDPGTATAPGEEPPNGEEGLRWVSDHGEPMLWLTLPTGTAAAKEVTLDFDPAGRLLDPAVTAGRRDGRAPDDRSAQARSGTPAVPATAKNAPAGQVDAVRSSDTLSAAPAAASDPAVPHPQEVARALDLIDTYWSAIAGSGNGLTSAELLAALNRGSRFRQAIGEGRVALMQKVIASWRSDWRSFTGGDNLLDRDEVVDKYIAINGPTEGQLNWTLMLIEDHWRLIGGKENGVSLPELKAAVKPGSRFSVAVGEQRMGRVRAVAAYWEPRWVAFTGGDRNLTLDEILHKRIRIVGPDDQVEKWALIQLREHWKTLPGWQDGLNRIELPRAVAAGGAFEKAATPPRAARVRAVVDYLVRPEVWPRYTANTLKLKYEDVVHKIDRLTGVPVDLAVSSGFRVWYTLSDSKPLSPVPPALRLPEGTRVRFVVRRDDAGRAHMLNSGFVSWARDTRTLSHAGNGRLRITQGGVIRYQAAPYDPKAAFARFADRWLALELEVERSPFDSRQEMLAADDQHPWLLRLRPRLREAHAMLQQIVRVGQQTMTLTEYMRLEGLYGIAGGMAAYERAYEAYQYYLLDVLARDDAVTLEIAAKLTRLTGAITTVTSGYNRFGTAGTAAEVKAAAVATAIAAARTVGSLTSDDPSSLGFELWQTISLTAKLSDLGVDRKSLDYVVSSAHNVGGKVWNRPSMDILSDAYAKTVSDLLDQTTEALNEVRDVVIGRNDSERREAQLTMIFAITDIVGGVGGLGAGLGKAVEGWRAAASAVRAMDPQALRKGIYDVVDFVPDVTSAGRQGYNAYRILDQQGSVLSSDRLFGEIAGITVVQRPAFREMETKLKSFYRAFSTFFLKTRNVGNYGQVVATWRGISGVNGSCLDGGEGSWPWGTRIDLGTLCAYLNGRKGPRKIFDEEGRLVDWVPSHGKWTLAGYLEDALAFPITYGQAPPAAYGTVFWYSFGTKRDCDSENISCETVLEIRVRKP